MLSDEFLQKTGVASNPAIAGFPTVTDIGDVPAAAVDPYISN
jgi:hypothetical protein